MFKEGGSGETKAEKKTFGVLEASSGRFFQLSTDNLSDEEKYATAVGRFQRNFLGEQPNSDSLLLRRALSAELERRGLVEHAADKNPIVEEVRSAIEKN